MPFKRANHNKEHPYTKVGNVLLRDNSLSLAAKGLLCVMLSKPDDWEFNERNLATQSASGLAATRKALSELESHGYLCREHPRKEDGRFAKWKWTVSEEPLFETPRLEKRIVEPVSDFPKTVEPKTVEPISENRTELNTVSVSAESSECIEDDGEPARSVSRATRSAGERPSYQVREEEKPYQRPDVDEHGNPPASDVLRELLAPYFEAHGAIEDE